MNSEIKTVEEYNSNTAMKRDCPIPKFAIGQLVKATDKGHEWTTLNSNRKMNTGLISVTHGLVKIQELFFCTHTNCWWYIVIIDPNNYIYNNAISECALEAIISPVTVLASAISPYITTSVGATLSGIMTAPIDAYPNAYVGAGDRDLAYKKAMEAGMLIGTAGYSNPPQPFW